MRRLRQMRRLCLERLWRMRRMRRLRLVHHKGRLPRLLRRDHVPTTSIDISCHGRVLLDPAHFALFRLRFPAVLAARAAKDVDKRRHAS